MHFKCLHSLIAFEALSGSPFFSEIGDLILGELVLHQSNKVLLFNYLSVHIVLHELLITHNYRLLIFTDEYIVLLVRRKLEHYLYQIKDPLYNSHFVLNDDLFRYLLKLFLYLFQLFFNWFFQDTSKSGAQIVQRSNVHPGSLVLGVYGA